MLADLYNGPLILPQRDTLQLQYDEAEGVLYLTTFDEEEELARIGIPVDTLPLVLDFIRRLLKTEPH